MIIQYACNRPASWPVNVNLVRQKQDLLSQSLECYIHRVVLITGFARDRKKEVVFSLSTLISYYPSVTKEDNRTKDDVKKFSRQRIINRSFSQEVTAAKFVYKTMNRRPCLCTQKNPVGFELWHVKTFFYSKQFAKLLTTWLKTIYSSLQGGNKNANMHTFTGPYF